MTMPLVLTEQQATDIMQEATQHAPEEICGLLAGRDYVTEHIIPIPNVAVNSKRHFELDHQAFVAAMFEIERRNLSLIGIYHSHPYSEPVPSSADIQGFHYPGVVCLIVGLTGTVTKFSAWQIRGHDVAPVELHIGPMQTNAGNSQPLTVPQKVAVILSIILSVLFMISLALALLPPAPEIP